MFDITLSKIGFEADCECSHCKAGFSVESREVKFKEFCFSTVQTALKKQFGFKQETPEEEIINFCQALTDIAISILPDTEQTDVEQIRECQVKLTELKHFSVNKAFSFFDEPFYFVNAMGAIDNVIAAVLEAIQKDSEVNYSPIMFGYISGEEFYNFLMSGILPEKVQEAMQNSRTETVPLNKNRKTLH